MKTFFPGLGLAFLGNNGPFQVISEISQVKGTGQSFNPIHKEPVSILKVKTEFIMEALAKLVSGSKRQPRPTAQEH